jgi:ACT domain-containing protein
VNDTMKCVITVLGKDRSGIVAGVANILADNDANIDDISQTIISGIFSMTMMVTLNTSKASFDEVQQLLDAEAERLGVQIHMQREDVFQYMYRV